MSGQWLINKITKTLEQIPIDGVCCWDKKYYNGSYTHIIDFDNSPYLGKKIVNVDFNTFKRLE
jgi:hypothetical protein